MTAKEVAAIEPRWRRLQAVATTGFVDVFSLDLWFINKARPWIALMAVGWEYGANMLTKYLTEAGENTLLSTATCIDNPFDLEEATMSSPYHMAID
ncbi:hypothetical protein SO802_026542 [Lithocarpus litseifolius]|uniref:Uncharacterized protein n=1 Tax=Lithocarpus litseifolius TaxID=425828 RepID=A0AAW2C0C3_9ROSI